MLLTNIYNNSRCGCTGGGGGGTGGGGGGGVVVVSCHPLPTSNVPVTIGGGAALNNSFRCNGSDTVFGSTTPITVKGGGGVGGSNSGHRGKDGETRRRR